MVVLEPILICLLSNPFSPEASQIPSALQDGISNVLEVYFTSLGIGSSLNDEYEKCSDAYVLFDKCFHKGAVSFIALIIGHTGKVLMDVAQKLFVETHMRNVMDLNAMTFGYALCGRSQDGLKLLWRMVQTATAAALRTLAFRNEENKLQLVECDTLSSLVLLLQSNDVSWHYEVVDSLGNLVHSSPKIKDKVLQVGALQLVISMLSSLCIEAQRESTLLIGQFAATNSDFNALIAQGGAVKPLPDLLGPPDIDLKDFVKLGGVIKLLEPNFITQQPKDCVSKTLIRLEEKICGRVLNTVKKKAKGGKRRNGSYFGGERRMPFG